MDLYAIVGYLSGLYWVKPDLDSAHLYGTVALVHCLDGILCRLVASQNGRDKRLWMVLGWILGIWALITIFLLPAKRGRRAGVVE